mmetsp:Transcript_28067/g.80773  ORF Transcript_28067/g.80773 Transcript_28067/m.80773 type:complete len:218 (+) Transcript_28067:2651-3304(+)
MGGGEGGGRLFVHSFLHSPSVYVSESVCLCVCVCVCGPSAWCYTGLFRAREPSSHLLRRGFARLSSYICTDSRKVCRMADCPSVCHPTEFCIYQCSRTTSRRLPPLQQSCDGLHPRKERDRASFMRTVVPSAISGLLRVEAFCRHLCEGAVGLVDGLQGLGGQLVCGSVELVCSSVELVCGGDGVGGLVELQLHQRRLLGLKRPHLPTELASGHRHL